MLSRKIKNIIKKVIRIFKASTSIFYHGNNFYCPVCNNSFRKFKTYKMKYFLKDVLVDHYTPNTKCPKCNSDIRHRILMSFLHQNPQILAGSKTMLHFAPEQNIAAYFNKMNNLIYIKADIEPEKFSNTRKIDITKIDIADKSIDVIICIHVLEHIKDDQKAIKELFRILKPNGILLIAVPIYGDNTFECKTSTPEERIKKYGIRDHQRLNGLDIRDKFESVDFDFKIISTDNLNGNYVDRIYKTAHYNSNKYLFCCTKN